MWPTSYQDIVTRVDSIDPIAYGKTRNFLDGAVTRLSPYISRGVISTKQVLRSVLSQGYNPDDIEKFIQELAWRDYWQQVWIALRDDINKDVRRDQPNVMNNEIPEVLIRAETGIEALDSAIRAFYQTGYLHNHMRMYLASIACNVGGSHWKVPAQWMYYHLLDADWASNALSWQWVSGANAGKEYYANQENINKYCHTNQKGTFLDIGYEEFEQLDIPEVLQKITSPRLQTPLPDTDQLILKPGIQTLIYNFYNLDPNWHAGEEANRVLLLEPSIFKQYPVSQNTLDFVFELCENMPGIQPFIGEFDDMVSCHNLKDIVYKEHPLNNYKGKEEPRDWMFNVTGYHRSFFAFWKKCKKELMQWNQPTLFG